jgi:phosphatidylglycerol---prolipoprotein diacylglyceryl transferase
MLYIHFPEWLSPEIIPGLPIRWYGLMYLFAFATAYILFKIQVKQDKLAYSDDDVSNLFFWLILGLIIGARIFSTLVYDTSGIYWRKPWLIFWPFSDGRFVGLQGMSYHGGLVGGVLAGLLFCRKYKWDFFLMADRIMAAIPLGYTFGRLGNFINGELYGRVTTSPMGIVFPYAERFSTKVGWVVDAARKIGMDISGVSAVNLPRHPSQLYEAFSEGILLWLILWFIVRRTKKFEGMITGTYLIGYGIFRFIIEYFREPDKGLDFPLQWGGDSPNYLMRSIFNFTTGQILCFLMILGGFLILAFAYYRAKRKSNA